jgi:hypothetical protein
MTIKEESNYFQEKKLEKLIDKERGRESSNSPRRRAAWASEVIASASSRMINLIPSLNKEGEKWYFKREGHNDFCLPT